MDKTNKKNQRTKRNIIVSAVLAILLCIGIIVGATFALFTSEDKVNVSVTSGNVEIEATVTDFTLYSPTSISTDAGNAIVESKNAATQKTETDPGFFANRGTADVTTGEDDSELLLKLDKMTPGDKVTFKLVLTNKSNVKTKYRMSVSNATDDSTLFDLLNLNIVGITSAGSSIWKELSAVTDIKTGEVIGSYDCYVELPTTVDSTYTNKSCTIAFKVEQVQGNAATTDDESASVGAAMASTAVEVSNSVTTAEAELSSADSVTVTDGDKITTVPAASAVVPAGATMDADATTLTLVVYETETPNFTTALPENSDAKTLEVKMDGLSASNDTPIIVTMYVAKGLTSFKLYHNGVAMNSKGSASSVSEDQDYYYNSTTGFVTMATKTFSPFTYTCPKVAYPTGVTKDTFGDDNVAAYVDSEGVVQYSTDIDAAIKAGATTVYLKEGATVPKARTSDVSHDLTIYANGANFQYKEIALNGTDGGAKYTSDGVNLIIYDAKNIIVWGSAPSAESYYNVTLDNCTYEGAGVSESTKDNVGIFYISNYTGTNAAVNLVMNDCKITGCNQGVYTNSNGTVTINNCSFANCATGIKASHKASGTLTINVNNTTFTKCGWTEVQDTTYQWLIDDSSAIKCKTKGGITLNLTNVTVTDKIGNYDFHIDDDEHTSKYTGTTTVTAKEVTVDGVAWTYTATEG